MKLSDIPAIKQKIHQLRDSGEYEFRHMFSGQSMGGLLAIWYGDPPIEKWLTCSCCQDQVQQTRSVYHKTDPNKGFNMCSTCEGFWCEKPKDGSNDGQLPVPPITDND